MLPPIPASFGRLSDVFTSSLDSVLGKANHLQLRPAKRVITVLVDGLGAQNLKAASGHAPFLNSALAASKPISCGFPSTTATSISSFATGLQAGSHGMIGYKVYDRASSESFNLLNGWNETFVPEQWQTQQTVSERAIAAGIGAFVIGPPAYEGSGFTRATMRGATYIPARTIADRLEAAAKLLRTNSGSFICYLYVPELDQFAHSHGVTSDRWLVALEDLDAAVKGLVAKLQRTDALVLTADHGIVDVKPHQQVLLDELDVDWSTVSCVAGDPRVNFVYLAKADDTERVRAQLQTGIGDTGLVLTAEEVIAANWYGTEVSEQTRLRMPELYILALKNVAYYHRAYAPAASLNMIGQHGGLSAAELQIPLLRWNL